MTQINCKKSPKDLFFIWNSISMFFIMLLGWTFHKYFNSKFSSTTLTITRSITLIILFLLFYFAHKISIKELENMIRLNKKL